MSWEQLSKESKDYVERYIRNKDMSREQALENRTIQLVIAEYEHGSKERLIFC